MCTRVCVLSTILYMNPNVHNRVCVLMCVQRVCPCGRGPNTTDGITIVYPSSPLTRLGRETSAAQTTGGKDQRRQSFTSVSAGPAPTLSGLTRQGRTPTGPNIGPERTPP